MSRLRSFAPARRMSIAVVAIVLSVVGAGVAYSAVVTPAITTITPVHSDQMTNLDVLRQQIKNYYGAPLAAAGPKGTWADVLNNKSNYAREVRAVAAKGADWLAARSHAKIAKRAIVLDVDDTTLTTWNYELFSNWDYNPGTNAVFVGLTTDTATPPVTTFTGNMFPPTPGMLAMVRKAHDLGYAIFWITGRGDSQHQATIANLVSDTVAGLPDITSVTYSGFTVPEVDAGYPMPTAVDIGHGGFTDGLFTKPPVGSYPAYLDKPQFCAPFIHATTPVSCPTIQYKSGTRAYIESLGYKIVADFGDQFSDLKGGFADKTFKLPNPNYFLP